MKLPRHEAAELVLLQNALDAYTNRRLSIVEGVADPAALCNAPLATRAKLRDARLAKPALLEDFARENPFDLDARLLDDARGYRHAVGGRFVVERTLKSHAILVSTHEAGAVYAVLGVTQSVGELVALGPIGRPPVLVDVVLLPWRGRIVWDGVVSTVMIHLGSGIRRSFADAYLRAKERGQVVTTLGPQPAVAPRTPRPARDWSPALEAAVAAADAVGKLETELGRASVSLMQASARLAQAVEKRDDHDKIDACRRANNAMRRVLRAIEREFDG